MRKNTFSNASGRIAKDWVANLSYHDMPEAEAGEHLINPITTVALFYDP